jgi:hypothetical protein
MHRQRRVIVLAKVCVIVGIAFALHGTITDRASTYRIGMLTLFLSIGACLHLTSRYNTERLMVHQARVARLTAHERQQYTEMGWKAARLDADEEPPMLGDAEIVNLPRARNSPQIRRNGSA